MNETAESRSRTMRAVKGRDTQPELIVRRLTHLMGFRFRLCRKDLPGCPDLVFPRLHKVIFINGCFWHGHTCPRGRRIPKSNKEYWLKKILKNRERDQKALKLLVATGWKPLVIWECEMSDESDLRNLIRRFLTTQ